MNNGIAKVAVTEIFSQFMRMCTDLLVAPFVYFVVAAVLPGELYCPVTCLYRYLRAALICTTV